MQHHINLSGEKLGFSPKGIKKVFDAFAPVLENQDRLTGLDINIGGVEANNFTIMLLHKFSDQCRSYPYQKKFAITGSVDNLEQRGFFDRLTGRKGTSKSQRTPMHFETFRDPDEREANRKETELFKSIAGQFLETSNPFHSEVQVQILELFANAFDHSKSNKEASCLCSVDENGLLDFCVCDEGVGFKNSFLSNPALRPEFEAMDDAEILMKATDSGISCNPRSARNPNYSFSNGGIGLYWLRKLVETHPTSQLILLSGSGLLTLGYGDKMRTHRMPNKWNGSIVGFRTNIRRTTKTPEFESLTPEF